MVRLIDSLSHGVPKPLTELITLGRTLTKRAVDVPAYFDQPGTNYGTTEADGQNTSARLRPRIPQHHPNTSPDPCSKPADSDRDNSLDSEEPPLGSDLTIARLWS